MVTLDSLQTEVEALRNSLSDIFQDLQFLDIIKVTKACSSSETLQTVFNSLNIYESLIYSGANVTWSELNLITGDYILKGKNNIPYRISGPTTVNYKPQINISGDLTWSSGDVQPGTGNIKGPENGGLIARRQNYGSFTTISSLPRQPVVSFYAANNEEISLQTLPYVISSAGNPETYTLTWNTAGFVVPASVSYAVIR